MVKVTVLGAGGGTGQALSLQLRLSSFVDELALYYRSTAFGVAIDLSHIPVKQVVRGYKASNDGLIKALTAADVVIVTAGPPITSAIEFTNRNFWLGPTASIVGPMIDCCGKVCPKALIMIVSSPPNALVPFAANILKSHNAYDARRLMGITTLGVVRAETFLSEILEVLPKRDLGVEVNVIGGHSAETIVPLFSQVDLASKLSSAQLGGLVDHVKHGGAQVYLAKENLGPATLSTAYATFRFAERACRALKGEKGLRECTFVYLPGLHGGKEIAETLGVDYFSAPVEFGIGGARKVLNPLKQLSDKEERILQECVKHLKVDIELGEELWKRFGADGPPSVV